MVRICVDKIRVADFCAASLYLVQWSSTFFARKSYNASELFYIEIHKHRKILTCEKVIESRWDEPNSFVRSLLGLIYLLIYFIGT